MSANGPSERPGGTSVIAAAVVSLTLTVVLAGCVVALTAPGVTREDEDATRVASSPTSSATSQPEPIVVPEGTVVATGELVSEVYSGVGGHAEVVAHEGSYGTDPASRTDVGASSFELRVSGLSFGDIPEESRELRAIAENPAGGECEAAESGVPVWFGEEGVVDGEGRSAFGTPAETPGDVDPSYVDALIIVDLEPADAPDEDGCFYPAVARIDLMWTMPDIRPDLEPVDGGSRVGAAGETSEADDGLPRRYTVAPGDTLDDVLERFDIIADDLWYLNPVRWHGTDTVLYADEVLNLDRHDR